MLGALSRPRALLFPLFFALAVLPSRAPGETPRASNGRITAAEDHRPAPKAHPPAKTVSKAKPAVKAKPKTAKRKPVKKAPRKAVRKPRPKPAPVRRAPPPAPQASIKPPPPAAPPVQEPAPRNAAPRSLLSPAEAEARYQQALSLERSGDPHGAFKAYEEAAESGHALAQKKLGDLYGTGSEVVERDYETSLRWYSKARDQGVQVPKPFIYPGVRR